MNLESPILRFGSTRIITHRSKRANETAAIFRPNKGRGQRRQQNTMGMDNGRGRSQSSKFEYNVWVWVKGQVK